MRMNEPTLLHTVTAAAACGIDATIITMSGGLDAIITTPTAHTTNAVHKVIELPELIEHIGLYLQPSDLFSCIQGNRLLK
ncbi:hypothetical protein K457DRAFT_23772 [Linnemannia elongata AG-77]|uniref:Uncharacterized protein n=1 Tax=Linnemannia elongata AG-77 TaxID=1314771 RepID=A0A197JID5_9FUNG|nr:hypothetical protein K457DRAFT_23772 [Linnemannia elongata AG-77]